MVVEGLVVHVCSLVFLGSYLYIGVSCDIQERKEKMCTRFSIFNTATIVPLPENQICFLFDGVSYSVEPSVNAWSVISKFHFLEGC